MTTTVASDDTVALVTGGASGIGLATATALLAAGVRVTIADVDATALATATASLRGQHADRVDGLAADVSTPDGARAAIDQTLHHHGRLDLLHLNAGRPGVGPLTADVDLDDAGATLTTNVMSAVAPFVAALPHLRDSPRAAATVTSSLAGLVASPADPLYAASKHALVGLVRSLAPAHRSVRINAVCPALVDTPMVGAGLPEGHGLPILEPAHVAAAVVDQLLGTVDGEVLSLEAGRDPRPVPEPHLSTLQGPTST